MVREYWEEFGCWPVLQTQLYIRVFWAGQSVRWKVCPGGGGCKG